MEFPILDLKPEVLVEFLKMMLLIRRFEERAGQIYSVGKIGGFCHLYIGQEAIAVGSSAAMQDQDTMITAYRAHGHMLARGATPESLMAELMGRVTGSSKGKGGSMHTFDLEHKFYGGHGIVGAQTSLGTGIAFAHQYRQDGGVCLTFLGDGASNQGQFFEAMNMASLWNLPVLYIIENNGYGMGTSVARACAGGPLHQRGAPFGIASTRIEGHDVQQVMSCIAHLLCLIRTTSRPFVLEIVTHRFRGHSVSDPGKYRTKEDLEKAKQSCDPISVLSAQMIEKGQLTDDDLKAIERETKERIAAVLAFAEASPEPSADELFTDVMAHA